MIAPIERSSSGEDSRQAKRPLRVLVVDIGNTTVSIAQWTDGAIADRFDAPTNRDASSFPSARADELLRRIEEMQSAAVREQTGAEAATVLPVAICSVVPALRDALAAIVRERLDIEPCVVGDQLPLPMPVKLDEPEQVGVDRVCAAAAAYEVKKESCVVVDFGSAITIDLVDSEGAFAGGAILPGVSMQIDSLHARTAVLPLVQASIPGCAIGTNTEDAIRAGVHFGVAGAVRHIVERMAETIGRWPPVVATGGHAGALAKTVDIFDNVVPDLCLLGVGLAYRKWHENAVTV